MKKFAICFAALLFAASVYAEPLPRHKVPEPLQPWIDWVLYGENDRHCPLVYNSLTREVCAWPSELKLDFRADSALFTQKWEVYSEDIWVKLPGNNKLWPGNISVNGKPGLVGDRNNRPGVFIEHPGKYTITGEFYFDIPPEWIQVPARSGIVHLFVSGRKIDFPRLDKKGRLWLKRGMGKRDRNNKEDRCDIQVHRLVRDTIPLQVITALYLHVSGRHRKINLGRIGTRDFIPMKLDSRLPVKIDDRGDLIVQARPGSWPVRITMRHKGVVNALSRNMTGDFNTDREIWSFEPHLHLRSVDIKGPPQIDPQQTTMPEEWKSFPAYLMGSKDTMEFDEKKRGDPQPAPDMLNLKRELWLDFSGRGFSVKDTITGTMTTGWRLTINPPVKPGRIILNGREQFITRLDDSGRAGIEMRYGKVNMTAEGRINKRGAIPVTGWDRDFHTVSGEINLPPGWSLFDAWGIDNIRDTWLKSWDLFDYFLVLIIALGVARLRSWKWGATALAALVLIRHEPSAPCWIWLNILAALALLKVVPRGRIYSLINNYRIVCIALLIVISLPFMVSQVRNGIYPQLKYSWRTMEGRNTGNLLTLSAEQPVPTGQVTGVTNKKVKTAARAAVDKIISVESKAYAPVPMEKKPVPTGVNDFDSKARIQTGYGMPTWRWDKIMFSWSGPVKQGETMKFIFISPGINMALAFIRVIVLLLLIYGISGVKFLKGRGFDLSGIKPGLAGPAVFLLIFIIFSMPVPASADSSFPPPELLKELKIKLTNREKPDCAPNCAVCPRMKIAADKERIRIAMEVHTLHENLAIPLPGKAMQWLPAIVLLNGRRVSSLYRDPGTGYLWVCVPKGIHTIKLEGMFPSRNSVQIPFPLKPRYVDLEVKAWHVDGIHGNGVVDKQLQFTRINHEKKKNDTFESGLLPQFVEITRVFHLGLTWKIETVARRKTAAGAAVILELPLVQGESVTSDIPVKDGKILITLGAKQMQTRFVSSLDRTGHLKLKAADTLNYSEIWKIDVGTMWHSDMKGIPVIHHQNTQGRWFPEFRPWPGEELSVNIIKPGGVKGQTFTVENTLFELSPGKRITNAKLILNIRSSRGSSHGVTLPKASKLRQVSINNTPQPINQDGDKVILPIVPGFQTIELLFRVSKGIDVKWKSPKVDIGIPSVDSNISVNMPRNRWVLFCTGPYMGPAVLFWSSILVLILLSLGLGRIKSVPLKGYHWFLLGLGLTQASFLAFLLVAVWLLALGFRREQGAGLPDTPFNFLQIILPALTLLAIAVLFYGIQKGLLGYPDMKISGNGSHDYLLKWYQDISGPVLPGPVVFSLPMAVYRGLILSWALWIAFAFIKWLRWGWECYSCNGLWRKIEFRRFKTGKKDDKDHITLDL